MQEIKLTMLGTGSPRSDIERSGPVQVLTIDAPTPNIVELAKEADILVQDAALTTTSGYTKGGNVEFSQVFESKKRTLHTYSVRGNGSRCWCEKISINSLFAGS